MSSMFVPWLVIVQAGLTWRIASDREIPLKTKRKFQETNYIFHRSKYLQIKHKAKFISLQAANTYKSTYYESYFADLQ